MLTPRSYTDVRSESDLLPPGGAVGTVPTDIEQATGLERLEILGKMQGVDIFDMKPLDASRKGEWVMEKGCGQRVFLVNVKEEARKRPPDQNKRGRTQDFERDSSAGTGIMLITHSRVQARSTTPSSCAPSVTSSTPAARATRPTRTLPSG